MAKARLREAGARVGVRPWIRRHPVQTLIIAATSGFLVGRAPDVRGMAALTLVREVMKSLV